MLRTHVRSAWFVPFGLFVGSLLFGYGLRQVSTALADGLILAAPLGLGWIAPLLWGRRAIAPFLLGSVLAAALVQGPSVLVLAALAIASVDSGLGWWYSRFRQFPDGLNRFRDLQSLAAASAVAAVARAAVVALFAVVLGVSTPFLFAFAALGLSWFFNLVIAAVLLVPTGQWKIKWTASRAAELAANLLILTVLLQYLFATAGPKGINYTFTIAVGMILVQTWLALRFHIRGVGLHRTIWLVLCFIDMYRHGGVDELMPLVGDPIYCGQFTLVLGVLLLVELTIAAVASDRVIETEANTALAAELTARNAELERLANADNGQRAFLDSVLNQMPAGVMIVAQDGSILWRNQRHRNLWGDTSPQGVALKELKASRVPSWMSRIPVMNGVWGVGFG